MGRNNILTLAILFILTLITAILSRQADMAVLGAILILGLSGIKFLLVAFNFMELKKANTFWKILLLGYLALFITVMLIIIV